MVSNYEDLSVATIGGGNALKQLDYQLGEAIKNCLDPNTAVDAKRTVTLKVSLKPSNDRTEASLEYAVDTRFPCDAPGSDHVVISQSRCKGYVPAPQMSLDEMLDHETGEIVDLKNKKGEER